MAAHGEHEHTADLDGDEGGQERGEDGPNDKGVPLPLPEKVDELEGVPVAEVEDVRLGHGEPVGPEEHDAGVDEGQEEQPLERGDDVDADLGGDVVEAEEPSEQEHGDGGHAEKGVDADDDGDRQAPGETPGADPFLEQAQEGSKHLASQKVPGALREGLHPW